MSIDADWLLYTGQAQLDVLNGVFSPFRTIFFNDLSGDGNVLLAFVSWQLVLSDRLVDLTVATSLDVETNFAVDFAFVVLALDKDAQFGGFAVEGSLGRHGLQWGLKGQLSSHFMLVVGDFTVELGTAVFGTYK